MVTPIQTEDAKQSDASVDIKSGDKSVEEIDNAKDHCSLENAVEWDEAATKRLMRKIDWRLIPFLALLYLLSFLDRTNIGNARLDTLEADLNMRGLQYNHALAVFFPFYVAAEVPSNMAMKRFRPSIWIPIIMLAWSVERARPLANALVRRPNPPIPYTQPPSPVPFLREGSWLMARS